MATPKTINAQFVFSKLNETVPYGIPDSNFRELTAHPNTTGSYAVAGYNLNSNDTSPISGWSFAISVTSDVSLRTSEEYLDSDRTTTVTLAKLSAPEGAAPSGSSDGDWRLCGTVLQSLGTETTANGQSDTGDCSRVLEAECISHLMTAANENGCLSIPVPHSCLGAFHNRKLVKRTSWSQVLHPHSYTTDPGLWVYARPPHEAHTADDEYDKAARAIWPMILTWQLPATGTGSNFTNSTITCLRANNVAEGSRDPAANATSAASVDGLTSGWAVGAVGLLAGWMVL